MCCQRGAGAVCWSWGRGGAPAWLRNAQGVQSPCDAVPELGQPWEPRGSGVWAVSFCRLWSRAGQSRQTALTARCSCGFPNMGVYFLCGFLFCFVLFVSFSSLFTLKGQTTTTVFSSHGSGWSHSSSPHSGQVPWELLQPPLSLSCSATASELGSSSAPCHALIFNTI